MFICSGIIEGRQEEVEAALKNAGLEIFEYKITDNWYAFGGRYD